MAYRSTKEKDNARAIARQLYIKEGLSLEEVHQSTGETVKTLRAWRNLGQWDLLRGDPDNPERERLRKLRDSLFDRIEAQLKDGKLPHTEIGLLDKVDRMIARQEANLEWDVARVVLGTLELLIEDLQKHDPNLLKKLGSHIRRAGLRIKDGALLDVLP